MRSSKIQISPPSGEILSLITTLSNPTNHSNHTNSLNLLNNVLSTSPTSYSQTCIQFARVVACPSPNHLPQAEIEKWSATDRGVSVMQLRHDPVGGWGQLREMAGLLLKNALVKPPIDANTKMRMRLLPEAKIEMKQILCQCIVDHNAGVRRVGSSIIASCTVGKEADGMEPLPLKDWGEQILGPFLINCLESAISIMERGANEAGMVDSIKFALLGSLQTLTKVLEDNTEKFERGLGSTFNRIIPCLLKLLKTCNEEKVKVDSLNCCVYLILCMPGSLVAQMNDFLGILSSLAGDTSTEVRKLVCRAIVTLLSFRPEYIHEHMFAVSQFILASTSDDDEDVALEACEFWLVFASLDETMCTTEMIAVVESLFPQLLPMLVKSMVYSSEKRAELLEQNALDEKQVEDRVEDVAPVFHKTKAKGGGREDDDESDDDDGNYDDEKEWCLRTCAAASLDSLASGYASDRTLPIILPVLQESLSHSDPWVREAGILALGAIEEGCAEEMYEHLNQLHPFLINQVVNSDTLPQVVCISCWSLAKYSTWAVEHAASGVQPMLVQQLVEAISGRVLDQNRKVQIASCSALGIIVENAGGMIIPYLEPIYKTLVLALERHHTRALLVTLETFGSIAENIGPATGEGHLPNIYLPPLLQMWAQKAKQNPMDRILLPLMESLSSIPMVIGMNFQPWSLETFENAMSTINVAMLSLTVDVYADEEADPMVCAIDILDGLVEGLGPNFAELLSSSAQYKDNFLTVLKTLVSHDVEGVRMSAFALMGDIAIHCPVVLQDAMTELINEAILCIDPTFPSVCNNAVWAIGEILVKCVGNPAAIQPFASEILQNLISLIMGSQYNDHEYNPPMSGLIENASVSLGRLAKVNPMFVATDLPRFLTGWVDGCAKVNDMIERRDAFDGLMMAIQANPTSITTAGPNLTETISVFLLAFMSWHLPKGHVSPEILSGNYSFAAFPQEHLDLHHHLVTFAHQFLKVHIDAWNQVSNSLPVNVRRLLQEQYSL